jgi:hypothetical protein
MKYPKNSIGRVTEAKNFIQLSRNFGKMTQKLPSLIVISPPTN